jgi:hypothetical protein
VIGGDDDDVTIHIIVAAGATKSTRMKQIPDSSDEQLRLAAVSFFNQKENHRSIAIAE